jgi:TrmH family RNA methyltransferase
VSAALGFRHARVQRLRKLFARRSTRQHEGCFVVEGAKALGVALTAGVAVESVYLDPAAGPAELALAGRALDTGGRVFDLEAGVLARVAQTITPQPVLAVVAMPAPDLAVLAARHPSLVVVCADVRDPGNAGTVVRAAEAAGADAAVFCDGAVDPFNPKTVRASAGAVLLLPVVEGGPAETVLAELGRWGLWRWGTVAEGGRDYAVADLVQPSALVLGNEAHGLPPVAVDLLDGTLSVPMRGRGESLNVGAAAAILCFEAARQRHLAATHP